MVMLGKDGYVHILYIYITINTMLKLMMTQTQTQTLRVNKALQSNTRTYHESVGVPDFE